MNHRRYRGDRTAQPGSRVAYALLFAGEPAPTSRAFQARLEARKSPASAWSMLEDASPQIRVGDRSRRAASSRCRRWSACCSAAIAVAMAARRYAAAPSRHRRADEMHGRRAALRARRSAVLELVAIAVIGASRLGRAARLRGAGVLLAGCCADLVARRAAAADARAGWLGAVTAIAMISGRLRAAAAAAAGRVPPAARAAQGPRAAAAARWCLRPTALAALVALLFWLVRDDEAAVATSVGGTAGTLASCSIARRLGAGALRWRLRGSVGVAWRYGLANIARRGRDSVVQIVAFGLWA